LIIYINIKISVNIKNIYIYYMNHLYLYLFHLLVVGPLFIYVGLRRYKTTNFLYSTLFLLGIIVLLYHLYKFYNAYKNDYINHVNIFHVLLVGTLLIYIGFMKEKTNYVYFDLLTILGIGLVGYFAFKTYKILNV
jgi:hypothetical protein